VSDEPIGIGIAGLWHVHAEDYARDATAHPGTKVVAVWDEDEAARQEVAARLGIDAVDSLGALLNHPAVGGITVTTATNKHTEVIGRAIAAGVPVFTEKLLAPTVDECESLAASARAQGVPLVVSLPRLTEPLIITAADLIDSGALGDITYARVRLAHDGWLGGWLPDRFADPVAAIGGAFADLGCHPAYLIQRFLGARPVEVTAAYGHVTGKAVEDNAVVTARYASGAVGVAEASFVTTPGAFAFEVRGTEASLLHGYGRDGLYAKGGRFGEEWTLLTPADAGPTPFELWVDAIRGTADASANVQAAIELTRFVAAANHAATSHAAASIDTEDSEGHA
jgi:1,5-anhydro-D-fructose reductase (1,5-anhydro-D-mannitol-forming)